MDNLTVEEKLFGLSEFWKTVSYCFVFFDKVPELDFDAAYKEFIPQVLEATDTYAYYRVLQRFCALLKDGHTNVYMPLALRHEYIGEPPLRMVEHIGKAVVTAVKSDLIDAIPVGSIVETVDGLPTLDYINTNIMPFVSASTAHVRKGIAFSEALHGRIGTEVNLELTTPLGERKKSVLFRESIRDDEGFTKLRLPSPGNTVFKLEQLSSGVVYLALNSFQDKTVVNEFEDALPIIIKSKGVIIDLRFNGGGSTCIATAILAHLINEPAQGFTSKSRQHVGNMRAYAQAMKEVDVSLLDQGTLVELEKITQSPLFNEWTYSDGDWLYPATNEKTEFPVYVLIGSNTGSAAEDFLVFCKSADHIKTVGSPSYGSTGMPIFGELPGGGHFRVCTNRCSYPDGSEFNGVGVVPDLPFTPSLEQFLSGIDHTLNFALDTITREIDSSVQANDCEESV